MPNTIYTETIPSGLAFDLLLVEGGDFLMGEGPSAHPVKVSSFYMAKYPVAQALWQAVMGENPSRFKGENHPVESVSWNDSKDFIEQLNRATGKAFRLPTEAEWEYAARGGIYAQGYAYAGSDKLKQVGWYYENANGETPDVGLLLANELGIHDLSGNVLEWCEDDWHDSYKNAPKDGDAPVRGGTRVIRGGSYFDSAETCRPAFSIRLTPDNRYYFLGFQLVLPLQSVG